MSLSETRCSRALKSAYTATRKTIYFPVSVGFNQNPANETSRPNSSLYAIPSSAVGMIVARVNIFTLE